MQVDFVCWFKNCEATNMHITLLDSFSIVPKLASNEKPHYLGGLYNSHILNKQTIDMLICC